MAWRRWDEVRCISESWNKDSSEVERKTRRDGKVKERSRPGARERSAASARLQRRHSLWRAWVEEEISQRKEAEVLAEA